MIEVLDRMLGGKNRKDSDLDIMVEFKDTVNLLEIIGLEMALSEQLGTKVDRQGDLSPFRILYLNRYAKNFYVG